MGFISDAFGKGDDPGGGRAQTNVQQGFNQRAISELRRQFDLSQAQLSPFVLTGRNELPGLSRAATPAGLDATLSQLFDTDIFGSLVEERGRAVEGQLAAGGLTRSGTALAEAARVPTDIGLALESLLTGRKQALAGGGLSAAVGTANLGAQTSGSIAQILNTSGVAGAEGIQTTQQARASGGQNLLNTAATVASIFFSDPSLKENAEEIGAIGDLKLYQWDWIEAAKDTMIEKCSTIGFMADEVKEKFPEFVHEFCGLMVIDYDSLLDKLEAA